MNVKITFAKNFRGGIHYRKTLKNKYIESKENVKNSWEITRDTEKKIFEKKEFAQIWKQNVKQSSKEKETKKNKWKGEQKWSQARKTSMLEKC